MQFRTLHLLALVLAFGVACGVSTLMQSFWYGYITFAVLFFVVLDLRFDKEGRWISINVKTIVLSILTSLTATSLVAGIHVYVAVAWTEPGENKVWMFRPEVAAIFHVLGIAIHGLFFLLPTAYCLWLLEKSRRAWNGEDVGREGEKQ